MDAAAVTSTPYKDETAEVPPVISPSTVAALTIPADSSAKRELFDGNIYTYFIVTSYINISQKIVA